ncbi:MAG: lysylphosphatidylglycerol synthase transmembrane domain-containing protein [Candidatus Yanofskybacteria bacterium]|nr:lysylphosphatidylglycerol synthase transmembrane domain-containing protein [Candidatus Yanofskybacteria bacterium]
MDKDKKNSEEHKDNSGLFYSIRPKLSLNKFLFYFITLGALIVVYIQFSELQLIGSLFARSNILWLIGIIALAVFSNYAQALNYQKVLEIKGLKIKSIELFPMAFIVQFLNQALPSAGLSGQVFFVQYLKKYGLSVAEGLSRALLEVMTLYMAFGTFFVISSVLIFSQDIVGKHPELLFFIYVFLFFAIIAVSLFFILQSKKRSRLAKWILNWLHRHFEKKKKNAEKGEQVTDHSKHVGTIFEQFKSTFNIGELQKHPRPFWLAYFWYNMVLFTQVVMLYFISFAIGYPISFSLAFIVFSLVKFVSMIAFVPGALGVFEGGMTLILLSFGVPASPAFAMTLLLRAFTFWFPMPVGWILYRMYFHNLEMENPYDELGE